MKKLLIFAVAAILAAPAGLYAQKAFYVQDGTKKEVDSVTVDEKGNYQVKIGAAVRPLKKADISYVWIPKPAEIASADALLKDGKGADAAAQYAAAATKYAALGWEIYSLAKQAEALKAAGKLPEATAVLEKLQAYKAVNPADAPILASASLALGQIYLEQKNYKKAMQFVTAKTSLDDDAAACAAYLLRGDIYKAMAMEKPAAEQKAALKEAAMAYFGAALLFEKSGDRPQALFRAWEGLRDLKDARCEEFAKILREKYPDNAYTKQLK